MKHNQLIQEIKRREHYNRMAPFPVYDTEIINDIKKLAMLTAKENSNNEPITFCKTCLSISIKIIELNDTNNEFDYCIDCSNTDLDSCHISEWEDKYEEKYGERFLTKKNK